MSNQRGFIPIGLIVYGVAALAVMAALGVAAWKVDHWCNSACKNAQLEIKQQSARADAAEAAIKAAQERATAIALLWAGKVTTEETNAKQRDTDRAARFGPILAASRSLPAADARVRFPAPAVRVLDDAIRAGNAAIARPAAEPEKAAATAAATAARTDDAVDVAGVTQWGVAVSALYAACADQVRGWIDFYAGLQRAQQ